MSSAMLFTDLIEIADADDGIYVRDILRTPEAQRMRRIRQNGLGSLAIPALKRPAFHRPW